MRLKSLYLRNFRNFSECEVSFSPQVNVIQGKNAQGKTNLLEAICLIATGRSSRCNRFSELIRDQGPYFYLEAQIEQNQIGQSIRIHFDGTAKRLQIDSTSYSTLSPLLGNLPLILHTPADSELISGAPSLRRRFLNLHLAQSDPLYVHHLSRFWRAMKQRNFLLKSRQAETIDCFEAEMAHSAAYLQAQRRKLTEEIAPFLLKYGSLLSSGSEKHELKFHASAPEHYLQSLEKSRPRDQQLGLTSIGPHRDEISFWIGSRAARYFASEGQKKTVISSLKLAEWDRMAGQMGTKPLMAIDELGLPFDEKRQSHLQKRIHELGQVFITTPIPLPGFEAQKTVHIESGSISE